MNTQFTVPKIPIVKVGPTVQRSESSLSSSVPGAAAAAAAATAATAAAASSSSSSSSSTALKSHHGSESVSGDTSGKKPFQYKVSAQADSDTAVPATSAKRKTPQPTSSSSSSSSLSTVPATATAPAAPSSSSSSSSSTFPLLSSMPALCPRCSRIVIEYLMPIEKYISDVLCKTIQFSTQFQQQQQQHEIHTISTPNPDLRQESGVKQEYKDDVRSAESASVTRQIDLSEKSVQQQQQQQQQQRQQQRHQLDSSNVQASTIQHSVPYSYENLETQNLTNKSNIHKTDSQTPSADRPKRDDDDDDDDDESNEYSSIDNIDNSKWHDNQSNKSRPLTQGQQQQQQQQQQQHHHQEGNVQNVQALQHQPQPNKDHSTGDYPVSWSNVHADKSQANIGHDYDHSGVTDIVDGSGVQETVSPYVYATIVVDNLSALNAILLLNSLHFYNNQNLVITAQQYRDESASGTNVAVNSKRIVARYYIPTIVFVDGPIARPLLEILSSIYDQMIELNTVETRLLDSVQYGIVHRKMHLWKQLSTFDKCIFLDSSILVVGTISNLFLECSELSACVDCFYPDHFNCSLLVLEPSQQTFSDILRFGLEQKLSADVDYESCDEATLLNAFFASKWNRLSFVYNFARTEHTYTQVPAYLKFGGHVRVVNFQQSSDQPWNFKFNLVQAQTEENPFESWTVDNYHKFYLRLFMCRVWPLISKILTQRILQNSPNKLEWTICELLHMLSPSSNSVWQWNPITLRRKTPTTAELFTNEANILAENKSTPLPELSDTPLAYSRDSLEMNIHLIQDSSSSDSSSTVKTDATAPKDNNERRGNSQIEQLHPQTVPDSVQQTGSLTVDLSVGDKPSTLQVPPAKPDSVPRTHHKPEERWTESMDWLGDMQSDQIINRLKTLFRN